ncbi:MAG: class I SAM-dependent methyltransferase [Magnetococcales bacterium]|nr:class I SAM-dependent methyltransferase [Magnetococcales bacterium]
MVVTTADPELLPEAETLAARFALPLLAWNETGDRLVLNVTRERWELVERVRGRGQPVGVEFSAAIAQARRQEGLRQTLARAVGLKSGVRPQVLDATPGLGRDAFVLAALGCRVEMVERSPVIHALLENGLQRALQAGLPEAERLTLALGEAKERLGRSGDGFLAPEVVYLDPMHPERTKAALVKKEMRQLRAVVGDDPDAEALLHTALQGARQRVVVKRPRLSPPLADKTAHAVVTGRTVRYDLYFTA